MSKRDKIAKLKEYIKNVVIKELEKDDELEEVSTTATAGAANPMGTGIHYDTPKAFASSASGSQGGHPKPDVVGYKKVNEASVSQVRSTLSRVKKQLMKKWAKKGGYENFGQKELRALKSKFKENPYGSPQERQISKMLDTFDNWAMNYSGDMKESVNEGKGVEKVLKMANDQSFGKLGGRTVDALSAGLFKGVYDKASDKNKEKINKMNEKQLYVFMTKLWSKFGNQVRIG